MKFFLGFIFLASFYAISHSDEEKEFSECHITQSLDDDPSKFANLLLDTLVKQPILDDSTASRILATFNVKGVNRNIDNAQAFTKTTISTLTIKGDADAANKFIDRLTGLFDIHDKQGERLIEYCMELILDNKISELNGMAKLAEDNGYGVNIKMTKYSSDIVVITGSPLSPPTTATSRASSHEITDATSPAPTAAPTATPPAPTPAEKDCLCPVWTTA